MRHAVLGAGGVGGLLGAALARSGVEVVVLMRPESLSRYPGRFAVDSQVLGDFEVDVPAVAELDREVDVLWVTPKATQLAGALRLAPGERVGSALVVPLLNGVDHLPVLRNHYESVAAGTMRVASERVGPGRISQTSSNRGARRRSTPLRVRYCGSDIAGPILRVRYCGSDIAGPILRGGRRHGIPTPATRMLADQVRTRAGLDPEPEPASVG